jgi:hypothetical protein
MRRRTQAAPSTTTVSISANSSTGAVTDNRPPSSNSTVSVASPPAPAGRETGAHGSDSVLTTQTGSGAKRSRHSQSRSAASRVSTVEASTAIDSRIARWISGPGRCWLPQMSQ